MANGQELTPEEQRRLERRARMAALQGNQGAGPGGTLPTGALVPQRGTGAGIADYILGQPDVEGESAELGPGFAPWLTAQLAGLTASIPSVRNLATSPRLLARTLGRAASAIPYKPAQAIGYGLAGLPIAADFLASLTTDNPEEGSARAARGAENLAWEAVPLIATGVMSRGGRAAAQRGVDATGEQIPGLAHAFQEGGGASRSIPDATGVTRRQFIKENMPDGVNRRPTPDTTTTADAPNASRTDLEEAGQSAFDFDPAKRTFTESQFEEGAKYSRGVGGEAVIKPSTTVTRPGKNPQELVMTRSDGTPVFAVADQITDSKSLSSHVGFLRHLAESGTFPETVEQMIEVLQLQTANASILKRIVKLMPRELMGTFGPEEWDRIAKGVGKAGGRVTVIVPKAEV
tara:strand:+ start:955 stop:2166 length:1212 start_codon:yes stop_codon:yes gene_type:complete